MPSLSARPCASARGQSIRKPPPWPAGASVIRKSAMILPCGVRRRGPMNQRFDAILKSGTVVNQDGEGERDIAISNGRIAAIGGLGQASAAEVIDCRGLHILPGVMDTQVHFREPGQTQKEDLETGSRSAVMGGVTAVFEMPNTDPLTVTEQTFSDKVKRGRHRMHCD